ncbi:hypothetical protein OIE67_25700 [Nonomuraea fuscirosea]|uniref:hypothetical protein n=1 Tax=Nonomuraea fuscirosea TaxID=1291556 RepID=UPI002DD8E220|nr:hypothetical protein [Nonomuraea fuscirosea]WSA57891.1 hypothetical protein OIE67_25700 [Nonomuraea fuscirosea]
MIPEWMWIAWLAVAAGGFAILEIIALINRRRGDTLSERTRAWLGITPPNARRRIAVPVFAAVLILFLVWFLPHIIFDIL